MRSRKGEEWGSSVGEEIRVSVKTTTRLQRKNQMSLLGKGSTPKKRPRRRRFQKVEFSKTVNRKGRRGRHLKRSNAKS